jgi:REP element-mobilizing transposase RayT
LIENAKQQGKELSEETERKLQYLYSEQIEKYLDVGYGKCYLNKAEIANLVANSFTHFDNVRYRLHAWCIMPNHVHVIVEAMPENDLSKIIHSWKSYTAHRANNILGLTGAFWQPDAYNHIIRSRKEYHFQIQYTWENPEKARLQNWQWRWKTDNI